jgi:hypothetical protein
MKVNALDIMHMNFENIFAASFDTFKVFKDLKVKDVGLRLENSPNTIWQILNHLILWQAHQLSLVTILEQQEPFCETDSWIEEKQPHSQVELDKTVQTFNEQLSRFVFEMKGLRTTDASLEQKLKALHEASTHLAFHLGEIILLRRMLGDYPMPNQMKEFLKQE